MFSSRADGDGELWTIDAAGGEAPRRLTDNSWDDGEASWSPDGGLLVFTSWADGDGELWVMDTAGGDPRRLTENSWEDRAASWSPDGSALVFTSWASGDGEVFVIDAAGSVVQVTDNAWEDVDPAWSPDGASVIFAADPDGDFDVFAADVAGGDVRRASDGPGDERGPRWSPEGGLIVVTDTEAGAGVGIVVRDARGTVSAEVAADGVVVEHVSGLVVEVPPGAVAAGSSVTIADVSAVVEVPFRELPGGPVYEITTNDPAANADGALGAPVVLRFPLPDDVAPEEVVSAYFDEELELWLPLESRVEGGELVATTEHFSRFRQIRKKIETAVRTVGDVAKRVTEEAAEIADTFVTDVREAWGLNAEAARRVRDRLATAATEFLIAAAEAGLDALDWVGYQIASKIFGDRAEPPTCASGEAPQWMEGFTTVGDRQAPLLSCVDYTTTSAGVEQATIRVVNNRGWPIMVRRTDTLDIDQRPFDPPSPHFDTKGQLEFVTRGHRDVGLTAWLAATVYYLTQGIRELDLADAEGADALSRFVVGGLGGFEITVSEPPAGPGATEYRVYTHRDPGVAPNAVVINAGIVVDYLTKQLTDALAKPLSQFGTLADVVTKARLSCDIDTTNLTLTALYGCLTAALDLLLDTLIDTALEPATEQQLRGAKTNLAGATDRLKKILGPVELAYTYIDLITTTATTPDPITLTWTQPTPQTPDTPDNTQPPDTPERPDANDPTQDPPDQPTTDPAPTPPTTSPPHHYTAIAAGSWHSCALRTDGTITCWTDRGRWRYYSPTGIYTAITTSHGHSCALRTDGTITCWDERGLHENPPDGTYTAVSAGNGHSCALRTDGTVTCWGNNDDGQTDAPDGQFTAIAAGGNHSCALDTDHAITCWGRFPQADAPDGTHTAITAGHWHSCAVRTDGTITCWGNNARGEEDVPTGTYTAVTAGGSHSCALRTDRTIACWGNNDADQADAPDGTYTAITAGWGHSCAVRADGTITCWGSKAGRAHPPGGQYITKTAEEDPANPTASTTPPHQYTAVAAGSRHSCALRTDRTITCWGNNYSRGHYVGDRRARRDLHGHRRRRLSFVRTAHRRHHHLLGQQLLAWRLRRPDRRARRDQYTAIAAGGWRSCAHAQPTAPSPAGATG